MSELLLGYQDVDVLQYCTIGAACGPHAVQRADTLPPDRNRLSVSVVYLLQPPSLSPEPPQFSSFYTNAKRRWA